MADNDVNVVLGADGSQAVSVTKETQAKIADSLEAISNSLKQFGEKNQQVMAQAVKNNADLSRSFMELKGSMTGGFNVITGVIERFRGVVGLLAGALAGGLIGKESVDSMLHMEDTVRGLEIVFGMSSQSATKMAVSLKLAGIEAGTFEQMGMRILMRLRTQSAEFERLGIVIKDTTNGGFLPMEQILQNVYKRMQDFKAGADQDLFVLTAIGRNAKDFAGDMQRLAAVQQTTNEVMAKFGIEMGPEQQAAIEQYRIKVNSFKVGLEAIGERIGEQIMPSLMRLGEWLGDIGPGAMNVIIGLLKVLATALTIIGTVVMWVWTVFKGFIVALYDVADGINKAAQALAHLDFRGAADAAKNAWTKMISDAKEAGNQLYSTWESNLRRLGELWNPDAHPEYWGGEARRGMESALPGSGQEKFKLKPKGGGGDTRLAEWKEQLRQMQEAEGFFHEMSKAAEIAFWEAKLATIKGAGTKEVALRREVGKMIFDLQKAQAQQEYQTELKKFDQMIEAAKYNKDEQLKLAAERTAYVKAKYGEESPQFEEMLTKELKLRQEWAEKDAAMVRDAAKHKIDMEALEIEGEREALDQSIALRQTNLDLKFAAEAAFENRLYALRLKGLQDELATLHMGTLAWQQKNEEIEKLEVTHQEALTKIANQATIEREKDALQASQDFESDFAGAFASVIDGTKSLKNAFLDFFKQLDQQLSKIASDQIAKQLFGAGTAGGNAISGLMSKIFGGGALGGGGAATGATAQVSAEAANTTAVSALTVSVTPLAAAQTLLTTALDLLTAAVNGNTAALQSANLSSPGSGGILSGGLFNDAFASFDVGTPYVPQDTLAFVHKGEAIIPAAYNRGGGALAGSGMAVHNHFSFSGPIDTRSQTQIAAAASAGTRRGAARNL